MRWSVNSGARGGARNVAVRVGCARGGGSLILGTMTGNPGGAAPADRPDPPRHRWRGVDPLRVSDADRDKAIDLLWTRYDEGRLRYDTFALRLEAAVHAQSRADLDALLADLPGRGRLGAALRTRWQRGRAVLAGRMPRVWQAASWPVLMFPAGEQRRFTIGRDSGCDMVLPDPTVSRWPAPGGRRLAAGRPGLHQRHPAQRVAGAGLGAGPGWRPGQLRRGHLRGRHPREWPKAAADPVESNA
jgi:DUF1707 SHOCT-like domain